MAFFIFIQILIKHSGRKQNGDPDQTPPHTAESDLGLHCLFMSHKKDARLIWVNIWASSRENLSSGVANNTGADQPGHLSSLISAFVVCFLESFICIFATGEILIF